MSVILDGKIQDTKLSSSAMGGTEMMRKRLLENVPSELLGDVAIYFSRPRNVMDHGQRIKIFYAHDLYNDTENKILLNRGWKTFDHFVFVSNWQRETYIQAFGIPYMKTSVIPNAIEKEYVQRLKDKSTINFIYHTTPHRGLELLYPIFSKLAEKHDDIHLDVFSSFEIYGWKERDKQYTELFELLKSHPKITYHGTKSNEEVLCALDNTDIFLYPCIWKETSCIAMLEAIKSGCMVVHPNLGALCETSSAAMAFTYEYTEDLKEHMRRAYKITDDLINSYRISDVYSVMNKGGEHVNSIGEYKKKWITLLEHLKNEHKN